MEHEGRHGYGAVHHHPQQGTPEAWLWAACAAAGCILGPLLRRQLDQCCFCCWTQCSHPLPAFHALPGSLGSAHVRAGGSRPESAQRCSQLPLAACLCRCRARWLRASLQSSESRMRSCGRRELLPRVRSCNSCCQWQLLPMPSWRWRTTSSFRSYDLFVNLMTIGPRVALPAHAGAVRCTSRGA